MEDVSKDQAEPTNAPIWRVSGGETVRLDAFLGHCLPHLSSRRVRALLEEGGCTVNGHRARKGRILFPGDRVGFCGDPRYLAEAPIAREARVPILFEDESLIAVDKPSGLATHGHSGKDDATLASCLLAMRPGLAGVGRSRWEPGIVHRLDRDTSGVVLAVKQQSAFEDVRRQFAERAVGKYYRAIVRGRTPPEGRIDYALAHDVRDRRKMRHVPAKGASRGKSWNALTHFRTVGWGPGYSQLEVRIETGVTHQIRVHMQAIGHPILGDPLYGHAGGTVHRCLLHASRLALSHPRRGGRLIIDSPLPVEFDGFELASNRLSR